MNDNMPRIYTHLMKNGCVKDSRIKDYLIIGDDIKAQLGDHNKGIEHWQSRLFRGVIPSGRKPLGNRTYQPKYR